MPRRRGESTAVSLLGNWTDSDTAMQIVGTSLGLFGAGPLEPAAVLFEETPLRNALFDILLSLVEGGVVDMRPTDDGRYAFRWRSDYVVAGLSVETSTTVDLEAPSPYLVELARMRRERDDALGRAEFAESLAAERERRLRLAEMPGARIGNQRRFPSPEVRAAVAALDPEDQSVLNVLYASSDPDPEPIAIEAASAVVAEAPVAKPDVAEPEVAEPEVVEPVVRKPAASKPRKPRASRRVLPTQMMHETPESEQLERASAEQEAVTIERRARKRVAPQVDDLDESDDIVDLDDDEDEDEIDIREPERELRNRFEPDVVEPLRFGPEPDDDDPSVVWLAPPLPREHDESDRPTRGTVHDDPSPRRPKWSGYTLDRSRSHLSSVDRLADRG